MHLRLLSMHTHELSMQSGVLSMAVVHLGLLSKALPLYEGVVQLRVSIAHFPLVHKQLKALCHARDVSVPVQHSADSPFTAAILERSCANKPLQQVAYSMLGSTQHF